MVSQVQNHLSVADPTMSWLTGLHSPGSALPQLARLSPAERVVAINLVQRLGNRKIAHALGKSEFTVRQ